jgi:mRNA interferase RelE/StbE
MSSVTYSIQIRQSAAKALKKLPKADRLNLTAAIDQLAINPGVGSVLKGEFQGLRRIRVGQYRVVYEINDGELIVLVIRIGHRREVYR